MSDVPLMPYEDDEDRKRWIDIGHNHWIRYFKWAPDRALNPQYDGIADIPKAGCTVRHYKSDGVTLCQGAIEFDLPAYRQVYEIIKRYYADKNQVAPAYHAWQVHSFDPLHVEPSLLCKADGCNDHGFIRSGRWEPC